MRNLFGLVVSAVFIIIVFISSKLFANVSKEASRKYIHIMLSNWWIIAIVFFDNVVFASIGPAAFVVINAISYKFNVIKMMERDEKDRDGLRNSILCTELIYFGNINIWSF